MGKKKRNPQEQQLKDTFQFFLRLMVLAAPLYFILLFVDVIGLQLAVAYHSFLLMQFLGWEPMIQGADMVVGDFAFFISKDSTGWKSLLFLGALILAVPKIGIVKRLWGLGIGLVLVYLGNITRVVGIVAAEQVWGQETAIFIHDVWWRFGLVAMVLGIWLLWYQWARSPEKSLVARMARWRP